MGTQQYCKKLTKKNLSRIPKFFPTGLIFVKLTQLHLCLSPKQANICQISFIFNLGDSVSPVAFFGYFVITVSTQGNLLFSEKYWCNFVFFFHSCTFFWLSSGQLSYCFLIWIHSRPLQSTSSHQVKALYNQCIVVRADEALFNRPGVAGAVL